jgi:aldose 1-epimerase
MHRVSTFGELADGHGVESIVLGSNAGLQLEVLTYGAILRRLSFPVRGTRRDLILKLDTLDDYVRDRAYVGSLVGRFGNRIANSRFELDGKTFQLSANEGVNHLHGGHLGFGKRVWKVLDVTDGAVARAVLALRSPDGEEGYPGNLDSTVEIEVGGDAVSFTLSARTDAPTPVNMTYHPYFNLNESGPATDQRLRIPATRYLPVRAGLIPTGEQAPIGTTFDFRASRRLHPPAIDSHPQLGLAGGYDHCWVLDANADCACELSSAGRDLTLTMLGTGPGLQFYNGQFLSKSHPSLGSGVILEPQGLPDAPNQPTFPSAILRPGDTWRTKIEYRLKAG